MRVNLDFAKLLYKYQLDRDPEMTTPLCRNSNIPEELGRIEYILTDKTGTLTQNEMIFKKLYISHECKYESDETGVLKSIIKSGIKPLQSASNTPEQKSVDSVIALLLCHNVTPVIEEHGKMAMQCSITEDLTLFKFSEDMGYILR